MEKFATEEHRGGKLTVTGVAEVLAQLAARFSCRDFDGSEIDAEILQQIVHDGTEAPSSCNQQNWHFIIVTDRDRLREACEISGGNHHFAECSALIYLCFQKGWTHGNFSIVQSVAGACYHMMLSAHLRGFQCIWNAGIGDHERLRDMLNLPPIFELQGALAIGRANPEAPAMKAPRRPFDEVHSWEKFQRPASSVYPVKPSKDYPFHQISNTENRFAEWDPAKWTWDQIGDFRGYAVWAKSPLAGVYVSRRQGEATRVELDLLPELGSSATVGEVMPWGGTYSAGLRRHLPPSVELWLADLSEHNLAFIRERLRQEGLFEPVTRMDVFANGVLPWGDDSLDAIVLPQALEHCPDPELMLEQASRVVRQGGTIVVSCRNLSSAYGTHWSALESKAQVPNQGPFSPIPAAQVRGWLGAKFHIEREIGIGTQVAEDARILTGDQLLSGRLYAARCRNG